MVNELLTDLVLPIVTPVLSSLAGLLVVGLMARVGIDIKEKHKQELQDLLAQGISGTIQNYTDSRKRNRVDGILTKEEKVEAKKRAIKFALDLAKEEGTRRVKKWLEEDSSEWIEKQVEATYRKIKLEQGSSTGNDQWAEAAKLGILAIWEKIEPEMSTNIEKGKFDIEDWKPLIKDVREVTMKFLSEEAIEHLKEIKIKEGEEKNYHNDAIEKLILRQLILASRGQLEGVNVGA
ncbi:MAG: hypothetical protein ACW990_07700 [Promethearchaeota archaeon]|jgi:hypothetical protein